MGKLQDSDTMKYLDILKELQWAPMPQKELKFLKRRIKELEHNDTEVEILSQDQ